jgi:type 1 glutamine amidotransferase
MVITFGKGKIFHTILGHDEEAIETPGFQILLLRAAEWAATGKVRQKK